METIENFIKNNKTLSWLVGIIGVLIIGGLGNGVWEYILKPLFSFSINLILNLSTLGIESFKNTVYLSIAEGFSEKYSIQTFNLLSFIIFTISFIVVVIIFLEYKDLEADIEKCEADIEKCEADIEKYEADIEKYEANIKKLNPRIRKKIYLAFFSILIGFIVTYVSSTKLQYINNSIIQYNQLISIATPYISEQEVKIFNSRFSLIKNKADYEKIINDLYIILEKNSLELKKRNIW